ncbi:unnamed protein product, partial [Mesorhabditis spiculigera]
MSPHPPRKRLKLDAVFAEPELPCKYKELVDYIRKFISDQIVFPEEGVSRPFDHNDLDEISFLGRGTFGYVSKMSYRRTGRIMAVKKVRLITNQANEPEMNKSLQRLRIEVEAIKKASKCDQIVQFYGVTFHEGDCWVCMEIMDCNLDAVYRAQHERLKVEKFDEDVVGSVAVSTIKALDHLKNEVNIIHRDVKPSNILLDKRGLIKLCDFGISGYLVDSIAQTMDAGCRPYMAPERISFLRKGYDIRSDVWSLGITLVEIATGKFPFPNFQSVPLFQQLAMVVNGDPPLLTSSMYSAQTINFVNGCLIKDVEHRPNFSQLMDTEYYKYYSDLPRFKHRVVDYVKMTLIAEEQAARQE